MASDEVHTTPKPNKRGWINRVGDQVLSTHRTKDDAVEAGREAARELRTEHVIHKRDGTIAEKNSYGSDPHPPKG